MIIEFFGSPGSGKTTFAHALAEQLRGKGYHAKVALSYKPGTRAGSFDLGIFLFVSRIVSAIFSTARILISSKGRPNDLSISLSLVRLIPPKRRIWRARIWQYILHLSRRWSRAKQSSEIIIFDQGYVQAIGSLAAFNGSADHATLAKALSLAPPADLTVRLVVPSAVVENRLRRRMEREPPAERIFEADMNVNMRSLGVFESINDLLAISGRKVISVENADGRSKFNSICKVEKQIISALSRTDKEVAAGGQRQRSLDSSATAGLDNRFYAESPNRPMDVPPAIAAPLRNKDVGSRLARASVFALLIYIGGAGLTSLAQLAIARLIGPRNYGIYSYVLAWTSVLAYLATLGFNVSLLRFVPAYRANGRLDLARGVIKFAVQRSLLAASLFGITGAALVLLFSDHTQNGLETSIMLGMAAVPLITAYAIGATLVRAFGGVVSALLPERIVRDGLLLVLVAMMAKLGLRAVHAPEVMLAVLISSAATVGLVFITAAKFEPPGLRQARPSYEAREWWLAVPPLMLITGLDVFVSRAGVLVLGWTNHIREAGIFALALNVAMLVGLSRIAVATMFSPTAADLHARGDRKGLQQLFARATLLSAGGAIAVAIPMMVIVEPFLSYFGEGYTAGTPIARVLILGYIFVALCGPQQNLLAMTGNEWAAATTMIAGAVANIIACALGVAIYGPIGAAVGVALALGIWSVAMAIYIGKRLKILPGLVFVLLSIRPGAIGGQQWNWFLRVGK
ncbi:MULTISPECIES: oligosaccharide flippase family protein [unclassified Mesorhizobium]|uniref:oligosaccharide flippase family protein n=1 Tax=unclassified Mesorhizobium TaxID=325217 RepID=UPI00112CB039|nr:MULTISPECIES: oligosaccharide flippase family protein [unclassified Mesorhizobium]TPK83960.1 exopolysaccharide biosynthesis protein [Mesorhizobium sp. B2-4-17]UCI32277.1 polysaccharide biosynthesis C-terminal domain-containing protein [Mesorhizobium sp. B4-1-4]